MVDAMMELSLDEYAQRQVKVLSCAEAFRCWTFATATYLVEHSDFWKSEARRCYQDFMQFPVSIREEAKEWVKKERAHLETAA